MEKILFEYVFILCMHSWGSYYIGDFTDGWITGYCEHHHTDGSVFKGNIQGGLRNGMGTLIKPDGTKNFGEWRDGYFIG